MKRNNYFLPFAISADVNYIFLFRLFSLAEYDYTSKTFHTIRYKTLKGLAEKLGVSYDTLNRERKRKDNSLFFKFETKGKVIELNSNFKGSAHNPFIILTEKEVSFLLEHNDNLLCKYFIYIKYYASKQESTFTQEQFLKAVGYCSKSGNNRDKLTAYNKLLSDNGFIIVRTRFSELDKKLHNSFSYTEE